MTGRRINEPSALPGGQQHFQESAFIDISHLHQEMEIRAEAEILVLLGFLQNPMPNPFPKHHIAQVLEQAAQGTGGIPI